MTVTRDRLIQGAVEILEAGAYDGLTIDALAGALRMSKSTLYKYFESKDQLVDAVIDSVCSATEHELEALGSRGARDDLREFFSIYARHAERTPRAVILHPERLPPLCKMRLADTRRALAAASTELVERGVAAGTFDVPSTKVVGHALAAAAEAAIHVSRTEPPAARAETVRGLHPVFSRGLSTMLV